MPTARIVPALDEVEDCQAGLGWRREALPERSHQVTQANVLCDFPAHYLPLLQAAVQREIATAAQRTTQKSYPMPYQSQTEKIGRMVCCRYHG